MKLAIAEGTVDTVKNCRSSNALRKPEKASITRSPRYLDQAHYDCTFLILKQKRNSLIKKWLCGKK